MIKNSYKFFLQYTLINFSEIKYIDIFIVVKIHFKYMLNYVLNSEAQLNIYLKFQPLYTKICISNYISNLTVVTN